MLAVEKLVLLIYFSAIFAAIQYFVADIDYFTFAQQDKTHEGSSAFLSPGQVNWINYDNDTLSLSTETVNPISGNASMRVDVKPVATAQETVDSWRVISTDFIPVKDDTYYNYSLDVSAKDVDRLHSKVHYFDSNKEEIKNEDFIFPGQNGTFKKQFSDSFLPHNGTKYVQITIWIMPSVGKPSSYLIDNLKLLKD